MKIAIGLIAILLALVIMLQSLTISVSGDLTADEAAAEAGAVGVLVGLFYFLGGAFAFGLPKVSMNIFGVAAVMGVATGSTTEFTDLLLWGVVAAILSVMSFYANRVKPSNVEAKHPNANAGRIKDMGPEV